jgi:D-alanyl-D-alanine carboxypeptidase
VRKILSILALFAILYNSQAAFAKPVPITAKAWLVADGSGRVIQQENAEELRSIASITKLMTAMIVLDAKQDLNEKIGQYTRGELIQLALVHSDNKAAATLCDNYTGGKENCVRSMNAKAAQLGMKDTHYIEATGLSVFNVSTANDLVKQVIAAQHYPEVVQASTSSHVKIKIKRKWLFFKNTNPIIGQRHEFLVSKTGYIKASGGCIVMMLNTEVGQRIVVVLGSKTTRTRIPEAEFIATQN